MQKISKEMGITETVQRFPETIPVFLKHGLHCIGCAAARFESIEQGAEVHGIDAEKLVNALNKAVKKQKKEKD